MHLPVMLVILLNATLQETQTCLLLLVSFLVRLRTYKLCRLILIKCCLQIHRPNLHSEASFTADWGTVQNFLSYSTCK